MVHHCLVSVRSRDVDEGVVPRQVRRHEEHLRTGRKEGTDVMDSVVATSTFDRDAYLEIHHVVDYHLEVRSIRGIPAARASDYGAEPHRELLREAVDGRSGSLVLRMSAYMGAGRAQCELRGDR